MDDPRIWWYLARTTGVVAWGLCSVSVLVGVALSTRLLGRKPTGPWLLDLHRFSGGLSVVFVFGHLMALFADSYAHFAWRELFVPMASTYRPGAVTWGIIAFYGLVAVEVTSLAMKRLPRQLWRSVHLVSFAAYGASTVHLFTSGSDSSNVALRAVAIGVSIVVAGLTIVRLRDLANRREAAGLRRRVVAR